MASETASRLKTNWMNMPIECFETLTFGELKVNQRFIVFPIPGDNSGHGGFRGVHYIFTKIEQRVTEAAPGLPYSILHGRAAEDNRGVVKDFPDQMPVILVR